MHTSQREFETLEEKMRQTSLAPDLENSIITRPIERLGFLGILLRCFRRNWEQDNLIK